ncbi:gibberellin receptor GID1L2 [Iris pallida]|uniref:Gibberellin receptor GID1L2 n=1 Tax=Iris pallida TaxID=29817 RepID=A0AAX6FXK9_IRIPA|nr:gibberellin receptor GID1L2 [Iris pallida]
MIASVKPSPPSPSPSSIPLKLRIFYVILNLLLSLTARFAKRRDGSFNRAVFAFLDVRAPPSPARGPDGVATSDHVVDPARDLSVRYFSPADRPGPPLPVVVYFHGGGFVSGSARSPAFDAFCRRLCRALPAHVLSVEYRLAPEHRFPAPLDDGADVLRWLDSGAHGLRGIEDQPAVFVAGDSAGGNIAHHVARRASAEAYGRIRVAGLVSIQPFLGGEADTESERALPFVSRGHLKWIWRSFLPPGSDCDHEAANVFGPGSSSSGGGDWSGFPAAMVVVGGLDSLQDRQRCYYQGLKRMGVQACLKEYPNGVHSFHVFPEFPEAQQLIHDVGEFVQRHSQINK